MRAIRPLHGWPAHICLTAPPECLATLLSGSSQSDVHRKLGYAESPRGHRLQPLWGPTLIAKRARFPHVCKTFRFLPTMAIFGPMSQGADLNSGLKPKKYLAGPANRPQQTRPSWVKIRRRRRNYYEANADNGGPGRQLPSFWPSYLRSVRPGRNSAGGKPRCSNSRT